MSRPRIIAAVLAAISALALIAPPVASAGPVSANRLDSSVLQHWLGHGRWAGHIFWTEPIGGAPALPSAARNYKIWYTSNAANGAPIVVTGTVAIPGTKPPAGGWPVVSWAHGTTGIADVCAPSRDTETGPDHDYLGLMDQTLDAWVARGFVVVQTDYQGLGTPGPHPYIIGSSEANSVIDIVRAARELNHHVGRDWVVIGHSQGGQAALFTDLLAQQRARNLNFLGAVAIAPGSGFSTFPEGIINNYPGYAAALAFLPLVIQGAAAVNPQVQPTQFLSPLGLQLYRVAQRTDCIDQLRAYVAANIPASLAPTVFAPGAATNPGVTAMVQTLQASEPATLHLTVPVLMVQSTGDLTQPKIATDALVKTLCANGATLDYDVINGVDHRGSVAASLADVENWVDQRLAGVPAPSTC
jgi:pimeloyl-ACP methyl ester carboxylesterase